MAAALVVLVLAGGIGYRASQHSGVGAAPLSSAPVSVSDSSSIDGLTAYLVQVPNDSSAWARLGNAELERGRATADPVWYNQSAGSFAKSLSLQPIDNHAALAGQAALDSAKHLFSDAAALAKQALAIDAYNSLAMAALTDALTELGRYPEALAAAHKLDNTRPGVASFARLSYQAELRGDIVEARRLMELAATNADTIAELTFSRYHQGLLALGVGDLPGARAALAAGLAAAPNDTNLLHLTARIAVASGDTAGAMIDYATLVSRLPSAAFCIEDAELLISIGRGADAAGVLELARAQLKLIHAAGFVSDPSEVLLEADHGDAATALTTAEQVWGRRASTPPTPTPGHCTATPRTRRRSRSPTRPWPSGPRRRSCDTTAALSLRVSPACRVATRRKHTPHGQ